MTAAGARGRAAVAGLVRARHREEIAAELAGKARDPLHLQRSLFQEASAGCLAVSVYRVCQSLRSVPKCLGVAEVCMDPLFVLLFSNLNTQLTPETLPKLSYSHRIASQPLLSVVDE